MPKRKHEDKENNILKKIAKYEKRLAKYRDTEDQIPEDHDVMDLPAEVNSDEDANLQENSDLIHEPLNEMAEPPEDDNVEASALDSDFLSALGEASGGTRQYGEEIHKEIFDTINKIILEGMSKQNKEKILENLLIPNNCKLLDAPKLNTELIGVLNNPSKTRDKLMEDRQQELGLAIGSMCSVINSMSKPDYKKYEVIKKLTNIARILCNLHYQYTEIRRRLVNPFLDKNLVESLKDNKREECLYSNLDTSVKSYSAMKRAANVMKQKSSYVSKNTQNAKNYQQAPRRPLPMTQAHPTGPYRGSYRGAHRYNTPRQPFRPQDNRAGGSLRGRAKYP